MSLSKCVFCVHTPVITAKHPLASPGSPHSADYIIELDVFVLIWVDIASASGAILLSHFLVRICVCVCLFYNCVYSMSPRLRVQMFNLGGVLLIMLLEVTARVLVFACVCACISVCVCVYQQGDF